MHLDRFFYYSVLELFEFFRSNGAISYSMIFDWGFIQDVLVSLIHGVCTSALVIIVS